jgi:hypothetical protein
MLYVLKHSRFLDAILFDMNLRILRLWHVCDSWPSWNCFRTVHWPWNRSTRKLASTVNVFSKLESVFGDFYDLRSGWLIWILEATGRVVTDEAITTDNFFTVSTRNRSALKDLGKGDLGLVKRNTLSSATRIPQYASSSSSQTFRFIAWNSCKIAGNYN